MNYKSSIKAIDWTIWSTPLQRLLIEASDKPPPSYRTVSSASSISGDSLSLAPIGVQSSGSSTPDSSIIGSGDEPILLTIFWRDFHGRRYDVAVRESLNIEQLCYTVGRAMSLSHGYHVMLLWGGLVLHPEDYVHEVQSQYVCEYSLRSRNCISLTSLRATS